MQSSAIALATNPTLNPTDPKYRWSDQGVVMRSTLQDDFNAIDPSVSLDENGRLWMVFGSFWSGIKLVELDATSGLRKTGAQLRSIAWAKEIEAPCLITHGRFHYLIVDWGRCCRGVRSTYEFRIGRSENMIGPYLDKEGVDMKFGGGTLLLGSEGPVIGPGHAGLLRDKGEEWLSYHFYDGNDGGKARLGIRKLRWDEAGWPVLGERLEVVKLGS